MFSIRPECSPEDRAFIESLNPRLAHVINAPTHSCDEVRNFQALFTATAWDHKEKNNAMFVAVSSGGEKIGYINIREGTDDILAEPMGYIALLAIKKNYEGKGVARALIKTAQSWAKDSGYKRVYLDVFASNTRALEFYKREGFEAETLRMVRRVDT